MRKATTNTALDIVTVFGDLYPFAWEGLKKEAAKNNHSLPAADDVLNVYRSNTKHKDMERTLMEQFIDCAATLYAWRKNKQCFRFAEELQELLMKQRDPQMNIPVEALERLPYNSLFVGMNTESMIDFCSIPGFFVQMVQQENELILHMSFVLEYEPFRGTCGTLETSEKAYRLHGFDFSTRLGENLSDALQREWKRAEMLLQIRTKRDIELLCMKGASKKKATAMAEEYTNSVREVNRVIFNNFPGFLQMLLYLCAENREITEDPVQARIYRKPKEISAVKDRIREIRQWNVGERTSEIIRREWKQTTSYSGSSNNTGCGAPKTPHVRRAHWHHYWTGSRKDESSRKLVLRWISPVVVNGGLTGDELPVTENSVK